MKQITPKVVIAQLNSSITQQFGPQLLRQGYEVLVVEGGDRVFDLLSEDSLPDLLIVDKTLKDPGAIELVNNIKQDARYGLIPILLLETVQNGSDLYEAVNAGCDDILTHPVNPETFLARVQSLIRLRQLTSKLDDSESVLATLARTIEVKDRYTMGHADRVAHFAVELGRALGVKGRELDILRKGGMLHDIGKIAIPDAILTKPGRYTAEEFSIMKQHPNLGCEICEKLRSVEEAIPLIRHHHERLDGTGYPDRLKDNDISPLVRIVTIVDIYDALRSKRSYKDAFDLDKSFQIMWEEVQKGWWDKEVLSTWEKYIRAKKVGRISPA